MSDRIAVMDHGIIVQFGTPTEVYDNPKTTFVASFIGNSNIFHGSLKQNQEGQLIFEAQDLKLPFPRELHEHLGQPVNLLLRPEHLQLEPFDVKDPNDRMGVSGTITFVTLLGLSTEYEVRLDSGAQLKIETGRSRNQTPLPEGSKVWVKPIDPASYLTIPT